ncbi:MAG: hypothetical protein E7484_05550 [Ruminococcaceae bacterium]|nr:hypothetical protein [Oscillospiraceae bacterium]
MKNLFAVIGTFVALLVGFVACFTLWGEGYTVDALLYRNKAYKLIQAIENEDYKTASQYLSFYGIDDVTAAREQWAENMEELDADIFSANYKALSADDGIVKTNVQAYFYGGQELCFDVIVQGKGLAISSVYVTGDNELTELYQGVMTTYNPG